MHYTISGEIAQNVRLSFEKGERAWASKGSLMAHSKGLNWRMRVPGGMSGVINRSLSGEGISLTYLEAEQDGQYALIASNEPGHITTWDLAQGPVLTTKGSFLAAWGEQLDITVTIARKGGAALFGGAGLFLQRIAGQGTVLIHGSGDFSEHDLADGQQIIVSTGNLAAFGDQVDYDIEGVGGCAKMLFGGEGLFMTRLTGPGRVLLQTLKRRGSSSARAVTT
jgi:uncharacterized protein (AIM24 family)